MPSVEFTHGFGPPVGAAAGTTAGLALAVLNRPAGTAESASRSSILPIAEEAVDPTCRVQQHVLDAQCFLGRGTRRPSVRAGPAGPGTRTRARARAPRGARSLCARTYVSLRDVSVARGPGEGFRARRLRCRC